MCWWSWAEKSRTTRGNWLDGRAGGGLCRAVHVEDAGELREGMFAVGEVVGLTAGTSTLPETAEAVRRRLVEIYAGTDLSCRQSTYELVAQAITFQKRNAKCLTRCPRKSNTRIAVRRRWSQMRFLRLFSGF